MSTTLSPEIAAQLDQLRGLHLPEPISWWPLAPGWWALMTILCLTIISVHFWRTWRRRTARFLALDELAKLSDGMGTVAFASSVSALLKRLTLSNGKDETATLSGDAWMKVLTAGKHGIKPVLASHLAQAPYAKPSTAEVSHSVLRDAARQWIRRNG